MNDSMTDQYIEFREPKTCRELEAMLRLRYTVRRSCKLAALCPENEAGIDIDQFDRYAYHVGLFTPSADGFIPVGCSRVVTGKPGPQHKWVSEFACKNRLEQKLQVPEQVFPSLSYLPAEHGNKVIDLCNAVLEDGETIGESCGACLHPDIKSIRIARLWVDSIVAYFKVWNDIRYVVMTISPHHMSFYSRNGFSPFPGLPNSSLADFGAPFTFCLLGHLPESETTVARLQMLASDLNSTGKIVISEGVPQPVSINQTNIPKRMSQCLPA